MRWEPYTSSWVWARSFQIVTASRLHGNRIHLPLFKCDCCALYWVACFVANKCNYRKAKTKQNYVLQSNSALLPLPQYFCSNYFTLHNGLTQHYFMYTYFMYTCILLRLPREMSWDNERGLGVNKPVALDVVAAICFDLHHCILRQCKLPLHGIVGEKIE